MEKVCKKCKKPKDLSDFYKRKTNKDGYHGVCKACYDLRLKNYYIENSEQRKDTIKKYNDSSKDKYKNYYNTNRERIINRTGKYYKEIVKPNITEEDKIKNRIRVSLYRIKNIEKVKERIKRPESKKIKNDWYNNKRKNDVVFKLKTNIMSLIRTSIKQQGFKKNSRTYVILGCTYEEFKIYLESKFESWMNWENYGKYKKNEFNYGWDIDHVIPSSNATNKEEVIQLNHYTNLQPLCSKVNRDIKRNIIK